MAALGFAFGVNDNASLKLAHSAAPSPVPGGGRACPHAQLGKELLPPLPWGWDPLQALHMLRADRKFLNLSSVSTAQMPGEKA